MKLGFEPVFKNLTGWKKWDMMDSDVFIEFRMNNTNFYWNSADFTTESVEFRQIWSIF
jgi:hypothetical protein